MWAKKSSILDYQKKTLCPEIWENGVLKKEVKNFIYKALKGFFTHHQFQSSQEFISHLYIGSSLATYFYKDDSDLDLKIVINTDAFRHYNPEYSDSTNDDIADELIEMGRKSYWLTALVPNTNHPLDAYFFTEEEADAQKLIKYDSLYNLITDTWAKKPQRVEGTVSPSYVLNYAKDIAQRYIEKFASDLERAKRDSIDFLVLKDYLKDLDKNELKTLATDFKIAFERVNDDLDDLIEDKNIAKRLRKTEFSKKMLNSDLELMMGSLNYSKGNLIYKVLQRYGYLRILFEISSLFEENRMSPDDVVNIYKILNNE